MAVLRLVKSLVKVLSNICYITIFVYILICIPYLLGYHPLVVLTGSMEPTYKTGSIIYYHKVNEDELKIGDPITFKLSNGTIVTHRINNIIDNEYQTKGDANETPDTLKLTYENILGKVSKITIPLIGYVAYFIGKRPYLIGIAVLIMVSELILNNVSAFDINKKERKNKNGREKAQ